MYKLNKLVCIALTALALAGCETFVPNTPASKQIRQDQTTLATATNVVVLVRTKQAANRLLVNAARRGYQLNERSELKGLEMILLDFERPKGVSGDVAIGDMKKMEPSASAGLNHSYTIQSKTISREASSPRLYAQNLMEWPESGCAANFTIGMIDGAVNTERLNLKRTDVVARHFSKAGAGADAHGTAIAELLVGPGRLKDAKLFVASVVPSEKSKEKGAGVLEMVRAIDWMQSSGVQVVNISLAGPYNAILERVVQRARSKGMIMIAAVGNDGPNALPRYPAAFKDVIAVTAIDSALNIYARAIHGNHVDFSAPGVDIFVDDGARAQYLSGTSVAAPFVTALIASDKSFVDTPNINALRTRIGQGALDLGPSGPDPVYGRGLVRASSDCKLTH